MAYSIDLDILDGKTPIEELRTWITYEDKARGLSFSVLMRYVHPDEREAWAEKKGARNANDEDWRWWLAHASDWRDVFAADGTTEVPFDAARLERLWKADPRFRLWFINESARFDNFRIPSVNAPAA